MFGKGKISRHSSQEATYSLQLVLNLLMEWESLKNVSYKAYVSPVFSTIQETIVADARNLKSSGLSLACLL